MYFGKIVMRKLIFLCFAACLWLSTTAYSIGNSSSQEISWTKDNFPRVVPKFDCKKFLSTFLQENPNSNISNQLIQENPVEASWEALAYIESTYSQSTQENERKKVFLDQARSNLLLSTNQYPLCCNNDQIKKKFLTNLINNVGKNYLERHNVRDKIKKWFYIHEGNLFLKYATDFCATRPERRAFYIRNAYCEFLNALLMNTTKTVHLQVASVLVDYNHIPSIVNPDGTRRDMNAQEIDERIQHHLRGAQEKGVYIRAKPAEKMVQEQSLVEKMAKPTYITEIQKNSEEFSSPFGSSGASDQDNSPIQELPVQGSHECDLMTLQQPERDHVIIQQDQLADQDFENLQIVQHHNPEALPFHVTVINKVGNLSPLTYTYDGKSFKRQNVSGQYNRCYFNALAIDADVQIEELRKLRNDPFARLAVSNDLMGLLPDGHLIAPALKEILEYDDYQQRINSISNAHDNHQMLRRSAEGNLMEEMRERTRMIEAYDAFLRDHLGQGSMMGVPLDTTDGIRHNIMTIDVIANINKIAIKIFKKQENSRELRLIHSFLPYEATKIAYLFLDVDGEHFNLLVPEEQSECIDIGLPTQTKRLPHPSEFLYLDWEDDCNVNEVTRLPHPAEGWDSEEEETDLSGDDSSDTFNISAIIEDLRAEGIEIPDLDQLSEVPKWIQDFFPTIFKRNDCRLLLLHFLIKHKIKSRKILKKTKIGKNYISLFESLIESKKQFDRDDLYDFFTHCVHMIESDHSLLGYFAILIFERFGCKLTTSSLEILLNLRSMFKTKEPSEELRNKIIKLYNNNVRISSIASHLKLKKLLVVKIVNKYNHFCGANCCFDLKSYVAEKQTKEMEVRNDLLQICQKLIQKEKSMFLRQAYREVKKKHPKVTWRLFCRWMEESGLISQLKTKNRSPLSKKTTQEYLKTNTLKAAAKHFGCSINFIKSTLHEGEKIEDLIKDSDDPEEVRILEKYLENVKINSIKSFSFSKMVEDLDVSFNKIRQVIYGKYHRRVKDDIRAYRNIKRKRDADSCEEIMPHSKRRKPKGSPEYSTGGSE